jgi:glutaredoxin
MTNQKVLLYSRKGCHLCQQAVALLNRYGFRPEVVDIDQRPDLLAKFDVCVPVVEIDGRIRFRGRIDERLLRRLINAPPLHDH